MKKYFVTTIVLALALFVSACGGSDEPAPTTPPAPTPEVPTEPEAPTENNNGDSDVVNADPVEGEANVIDAGSDVLGGGTEEALGSKIGSVACDRETNKITFTFENTGEYTWSLDQEIGFGTQGDVRNVKIFMNHRYEMNDNSRVQYHPETGEEMFGPNELFSDNCGGVKELAVGESATCTMYPVRLNEGTGSNDLRAVNYILIDSPAIDDLITFTC